MKRLRQFEEENAKLKTIVGDLSRQGHASRCAFKKALRPDRKRELVAKVRVDWKVSIRRAYAALRIDRTLYVYSQNAAVRPI